MQKISKKTLKGIKHIILKAATEVKVQKYKANKGADGLSWSVMEITASQTNSYRKTQNEFKRHHKDTNIYKHIYKYKLQRGQKYQQGKEAIKLPHGHNSYKETHN